MHFGILNDLVIIFGLSIIVVYLFNKIKVPAIVGFLLTGLIAGPYGLKLISGLEQVDILSEIGIILIMFSIGLEFSISKLMRIKRNILVGGSLQVFLTLIPMLLFGSYMGLDFNKSLFVGFLLSLSSTAIVMKLIIGRNATDSPQGKVTLSMLIYQDMIVLPMFLITPMLVGKSGDTTTEILKLLATIMGIIGFLFVSIKYVMPKLIYRIAKTRIKELFMIGIFAICAVIVWLSDQIGLSVSLGAFLAGLIISETDYNEYALSFIEPFREVFSSFFFISIGMLLNIGFVGQNWGIILALALSAVLIKAIFASTASIALMYPARIAIIAGFALAQIGEFSFVLAKFGLGLNVIDNNIYQTFLAVSIITMMATPFIFDLGHYLSDLISKKKLGQGKFFDYSNETEVKMSGHIVIMGYGVVGRNIAKAARMANIPYSIIEMNPETVKTEKAKGEIIVFGDASKETVLHSAGIDKAAMAVSTVPDPYTDRIITLNVKQMNPNCHLIVRTRFVSETEPLLNLGADEVIPEEFEISLEIFTRVLNRFLVPKEEIEDFIQKIRFSGYQTLRSINKNTSYTDLLSYSPGFEISSVRLPEGATIIGMTINQANLRKDYDLTVLAVYREGNVITNPGSEFVFVAKDILVIYGNTENINSARGLLRNE